MTIEDFLRRSHSRTAEVLHRVGRPLRHALKRWGDSDKPRARFLYEGAGIAVYVIAYLLMFALHVAFGSTVIPDLPSDEDVKGNSPSEKRP